MTSAIYSGWCLFIFLRQERGRLRHNAPGKARFHITAGGIPCSLLPFGYREERDAGNEKVMVPDEGPAGIVRRIYEEIAAGKSQTEVARDLNKEKIPTPY